MLPPGFIHINQQQLGCFIHKQHKTSHLTISYNAAKQIYTPAKHIRKAAKHIYNAAMTVCRYAKNIYTAAMTVRRPAKHIRRFAKQIRRPAKPISTPANAICNAAKNRQKSAICISCPAGSCKGRSPPTIYISTATNKFNNLSAGSQVKKITIKKYKTMDSRNEARLNMYRAVQLFCNNNSAITVASPAFTAALATLDANISAIISTASSQTEVITGIAIDKTVLKKNLSQAAADLAALVYAYAVSINNNTLKQEVNYAYSDFYRIKDDLLAPTAQNVHDAATANLAALAPYGVIAPMLAALLTTIQNYGTAVPTPRNAKALKSTYAANLKQLFKQTDNLLKNQLDKIVVSFKTTQPDFYNTWLNNRIIIDPSKTETQIKGLVTDQLNNEPVIKVPVTLTGPTNNNTLTGMDGKYIFKPIIPGTYQLQVQAQGFQPATFTVVVKLGQALTQDIQLTQS